ncbi:MAG: hypothetical protein N2Z74_10235, partial [Syntrophales bacterium]|nr:hypothetical protein [Syntrophales bacterium]
ANPYVPPRTLQTVLTEAGKDERVDLQIQVPLLYHFKSLAMILGAASLADAAPYEEMAAAAGAAQEATGKPVVVVLPNPRRDLDDADVEEVIKKARRAYLARGIPAFSSLADAFRAIRHASLAAAAIGGKEG